MSKIYLQGSSDAIRTNRTARGHKHAHADLTSWTDGVYVACTEQDGERLFEVYRTGGSNNRTERVLVAWWWEGRPLLEARLDCGTLDGVILDAMKAEGFEEA